ncbi:MAG: hypothetical protein ACHQVS_00905 [Candidatus Babeliales bacterium]
MKKIIITSLVCMHVLATPALHAWQLPKQLDGKQLGIIAAVTAVVLSLVGIALYKQARKAHVGAVQQPGDGRITVQFTNEQWEEGRRISKEQQKAELQQALSTHQENCVRILRQDQDERINELRQEFAAKQAHEDRAGVAAVPQQPEQEDSQGQAIGLLLRNYLQVKEENQSMCKAMVDLAKRIEGQEGDVAFVASQISGALETLNKNEKVITNLGTTVEHHRSLMMGESITFGKLMQRVTACEKLLQHIQEQTGIKAENEGWIKLNTAEKEALQEGTQARQLRAAVQVKEVQGAGSGQLSTVEQQRLERAQKMKEGQAIRAQIRQQREAQQTKPLEHTPTPSELGVSSPCVGNEHPLFAPSASVEEQPADCALPPVAEGDETRKESLGTLQVHQMFVDGHMKTAHKEELQELLAAEETATY